MSYVEKNVRRDDTVIMQIRTNKVALVGPILFNIVLLIFDILISGELYELAGLIHITYALILVITVGLRLLTIKNTELALTRKQLIGKVGVFNVKSMDAPLNKVNNISVSQGIIGRIFNYSEIEISTAAGKYKFNFVMDGDMVKSKIMEQIDEYENEKLRQQAEQMMRINPNAYPHA